MNDQLTDESAQGRAMTMFTEWMLSCGHQIGCGVHASRACSCSALRGAQAKPGNPVCSIPHAPSEIRQPPGVRDA